MAVDQLTRSVPVALHSNRATSHRAKPQHMSPVTLPVRRRTVLHWLRLCYCVYGLVGYRLVLRAQAYEGQIAAGGGSTSSSELINSLYFQVQPADLYVIEGETAELKCQLKPHTDAGPVQWAKDGFLLGYDAIIPGHPRYLMSVNASSRTYNLVIRDAQIEDEGEFECQTSASSSGSKQPIRASANLYLIVPPKSIVINSSRPNDNPVPTRSLMPLNSTLSLNTFVIEVHEGEKIGIVCSVPYAKPPPQLKWFRKNIALLPEAAKTTVSKTVLSNRHSAFAVESSLILYPKGDEEYKCQAEHRALSKPLRAVAQINIFKNPSPPVIDGYKNGEVVNYQEKLNLKCTSSGGYPPPSVVWLRNGLEIDRSSQVTNRHEVVNTLSFVVDQSDNLAQYTCQVINALTPMPLQESVTLNVLRSAVTLECSAHPASPAPNESKIRWLIDGKEVNFEGGGNSGVGANYVHMVKHDQQSWTIRSNLTFVINSKEPSMRNVACIAYSSNGKFETVSTTHQISVIYPPEMPTLLGVKNGLATVRAGEIFKCKCVAYSGNPKANLLWLTHHNREISAPTSSTGSGVSSELVIRPTPADHGSVYRCHLRHPALQKPYEVSFTLEVLFPPDELNITFPKFIKENDTIKIECTASPSNPCPSITLLKDGKKMDEQNDVIIESWDEWAPSGNGDQQDFLQPAQSVAPHRGVIYQVDCARRTLHHNATSRERVPLAKARSVTTLLLWTVRPEDDGSEVTCVASNPLIPHHEVRRVRTLSVQYKPRFNSILFYAELSEHDSQHQAILVRANPHVDGVQFSRVKETSQAGSGNGYDNGTKLMLSELIHHLDNVSWLLEPIPEHWSWTLSPEHDTILFSMHNASSLDAGLYVARVSNTIGDSTFFVRLNVKTMSAINSIRVFTEPQREELGLARENDSLLRIRCEVTSHPSVSVKWSKQSLYGHYLAPTTDRTHHRLLVSNNFLIDPSPIESDSPIDWSRSNASQWVEASATSEDGHSMVAELAIHQVVMSDAGIYTCSTPNDSRRVQVKVQHRPRIVPAQRRTTPKVAANAGTPFVKFVCSALAYPIASFNWTVKGNKVISEAERFELNDKYRVVARSMLASHRHSDQLSAGFHHSSELIIHHLEEDDFRSYKCFAYNQFGFDQVTFELVHKSFPETPSNLVAFNVTHNSAFVTWEPGFDYGHEQFFTLQLWRVNQNQLEEKPELLDILPGRTFPNITANYYHVTNLEQNAYYRLSVMAQNSAGKSPKSIYFTIQTLQAGQYRNKPIYVSADEQKLNGLIGNKIIGEDILELTVFLCLVLLVALSLVGSIVVYCRRRQQHQASCDKQSRDSAVQPESVRLMEQLTCDSGNGGDGTKYPMVPDYSAQAAPMTPTARTTGSSGAFVATHHPTHHPTHHESTLVSAALSTPLCGTINLTASQMQHQHSGASTTLDNHSKYKRNNYCAGNYLTLSSPGALTSCDATPLVDGTTLYPYELTTTASTSSDKSQETSTTNTTNTTTTGGGNSLNDTYDKLQFVLSHQQITNVQLLPETLEAIESAQLAEASYHISFAPIQYDTSSLNKSTSGANLCALPLASFDLSPQFSLDSRSTSMSSPSNPHKSFFYTSNGQPHSSNLHVTFDPNIYDTSQQMLPDLNMGTLPKQSKQNKRVNLVKMQSPSSPVGGNVILSTLNEEDEV